MENLRGKLVATVCAFCVCFPIWVLGSGWGHANEPPVPDPDDQTLATMIESNEANQTVTQTPQILNLGFEPTDTETSVPETVPTPVEEESAFVNVMVIDDDVVMVFEEIEQNSLNPTDRGISTLKNDIGEIRTTYKIFKGPDSEETMVQIWSRWNGDDQPKLDEPRLLETGTDTYKKVEVELGKFESIEIMEPLIVSSHMIFEDPDKPNEAVYVVVKEVTQEGEDEYSVYHLTDFLIVPVEKVERK